MTQRLKQKLTLDVYAWLRLLGAGAGVFDAVVPAAARLRVSDGDDDEGGEGDDRGEELHSARVCECWDTVLSRSVRDPFIPSECLVPEELRAADKGHFRNGVG